MASNNTIVINISAKDDASRVISKVTSQLDNGLTKSLGSATLGANLMTNAITAGLQAVGSLATKSISLFNQAAKSQSSIISTAGNVMKLAGYNFKQATAFVEDFQTEMAKVAASLPGTASDFADFGRGIIDNVIPAFAGLDGKLDSIERKGALNRVKELSTWGTLLSQNSGIDSTLGARQAGFFLSGTRTLQQLKGLNLYEQNITFTNELERLLNGRDLRKLSDAERQKIFLQAAQLDPEVLDALSESVEGVFGLVNDKLFGLETGIFGFMRDLDSQTEGKQTALKSINKSLLALFGPEGFFDTLDTSLKKLGISIGDPMRALSNTADNFTNTINSLTEFLKDFNATGDLDYLKSNLSKLFNPEVLGKKLALFVNKVFDVLINLNPGDVIGLLITGISGLFKGLGSFLANLDGKVYASMGVAILLGVGLKALFAVIATKLLTIGAAWFASSILPTILAQLAPVLLGIMSGPAGWIALTIAAIGLIVIGLIKSPKLRSEILNGYNKLRDTVTKFFDDLVSAIPVVGDLYKGTKSLGKKVDESLGKGTSSSFVRFGPLGVLDKFLNNSRFQNWWDKTTGKIPNSANGLNYQGLLNAAIRESKAAPPGSGLVMANTSEAILNRQQQAALTNSLSRRGGNLNIGSLVINTQATDAKSIAKDVVRYITQEWNNYNQSYVNAPVV